jgi:hypothetical protein
MPLKAGITLLTMLFLCADDVGPTNINTQSVSRPNYSWACVIRLHKELRILSIRGGYSRQRFAKPPSLPKSQKEKIRIVNKMKVKLSRIKSRNSILERYEQKWLNVTNGESNVHPKGHLIGKHAQNPTFTNWTSERNTTATASRGIESILKNLNSSGLCRTDELDHRVHAFIIRLKKAGKRDLVSTILTRLLQAHAPLLVQLNSISP